MNKDHIGAISDEYKYILIILFMNSSAGKLIIRFAYQPQIKFLGKRLQQHHSMSITDVKVAVF